MQIQPSHAPLGTAHFGWSCVFVSEYTWVVIDVFSISTFVALFFSKDFAVKIYFFGVSFFKDVNLKLFESKTSSKLQLH